MAKIDLRHAYHTVHIHPNNYQATGLKWKFYNVVQFLGSTPPRDAFQIRFSSCFYLSFMPGQVNFSDIAIVCNRPNNCCQQNLECFDEPLLSLGLFS